MNITQTRNQKGKKHLAGRNNLIMLKSGRTNDLQQTDHKPKKINLIDQFYTQFNQNV